MKYTLSRWACYVLFLTFISVTNLLSQLDPCSMNAGMDMGICDDDTSFTLEGSYNGNVDPTTINWSGPVGFNIQTPNQLTTLVTPTGINFPPGIFEFYLGGMCDGDYYEDTVVITVTHLDPPIIFHDGIPENGPIHVCRQVTLSIDPPPGLNQSGFWTTIESFSLIFWHFEPSDDGDSLVMTSFQNNGECETFNIIYTLDEEGCRKHDTIEVIFENAGVPAIIHFPNDSVAYCLDTADIWGNRPGCNGTGTWNWLSTPMGVDPDVIATDYNGSAITCDFNPSGSGWYTAEYTVNGNPPCPTTRDTHDFFICVTNLSFGNSYTFDLFCDSLPLSGTLINTNDALDAGCPPDPWTSDEPLVTIVGNTWSIPPGTGLTEIRFEQVMRCQDCELEGDTVLCYPVHTHDVATGPNVEVDADTILLSCGGELQFQPLQHVTITSQVGYSRQVCVTDAPVGSGVIIGDCGFGGFFVDVTTEGFYQFRIIVSNTGASNGIICRDTAFLNVLVQTLDNPCAGVVSNVCVGVPVQLDGCDPSGPADIHWEQIDGNAPLFWDPSQDTQDPFITASEPGVYQLEYSFSRSLDCYLADTLTFVVDSCDTCDITPRAWLNSIRCRWDDQCNEVYGFSLAVFDQTGCHQNLSLQTSSGIITGFITFYSGNTLYISGTLTNVPPGTLVCVEIIFDNDVADCPLYCPTEVCFETPYCSCEFSQVGVDKIPDCVKPQNSYCLQVEFNYCGPEGPMNWLAGINSSDGLDVSFFFNNATGDNTAFEGYNSWTVCFGFSGPCADELVLDLVGSMENSRCYFNQEIKLDCCCKELEWEFTDIECVWIGGSQAYTYELVVYGGADCGEDVTATTNGDAFPPIITNNGADLIITGTVFGLTAPGELCVEVDFAKEDCCDIKACHKLPCCCEKSPYIKSFDINCVIDDAGNTFYEFEINIGNPNGWAEDYVLTADCGTVNSTWAPDGGFIIVTGTLTGVTGDPGDECCFSFDFDDCRICDVTKCVELPPCECVTDVEVVYPDCVTPGEEFCVTYNFNYWGPPTTGVWADWTIVPSTSSPGWTMTSPVTQNPVNEGANSWEVCLVYDGECLDPIDLVVKAFMFYQNDEGSNIVCCSIRDARELHCCCECDVDIFYCADEERIEKWLKDISTDTKRMEDPRAQRFIEKYSRRETPCEPDPCCPICEEPDLWGPLSAEKPDGTDFPASFTYLWSNGETTQTIYGSPGTYWVIVTDPATGCEYFTEITVDCEKGDGEKLERGLNDKDDLWSDISIYPVPTNNILMIESNLLIGNDLFITDYNAKVVYAQKALESNSHMADLSQHPNGTYFVFIKNKEGQTIAIQRAIIIH